MSYFRADTSNSQGWRPGTLQLGYLSSGRQNGPNWKVVAAQQDAAIRMQRHRSDAAYRASMGRMNAVDKAARGDRSRVRVARLSGLSGLDLSTQMVKGAQYIFHFTYGGIGIRPGMDAITKAVAADANFLNPVASQDTSGVNVRFTYNGPGTTASDTVGNYGAEMQNVINTFSVMGIANSLLFSSAEGGPASVTTATLPAGVTVFTTSPDGNIIQYSDGSVQDLSTGMIVNPDGTIRSAGGTPPGAQPPNPNAFNWTQFLGSLGLSVGVGTAIAVGLGFLILKN